MKQKSKHKKNLYIYYRDIIKNTFIPKKNNLNILNLNINNYI